MKKKILLLILILCIALGGVGYAYYLTRETKSNKDLFISYLTKNEEPREYLKVLNNYNEKKEQNSYKTKGKVVLNGSGAEDDESIQMLNNSKITFEGKRNPAKNMTEQEITAVLGMGINVPLNYKQDGNIYGVQTNLLSRKYIAVKNENLKELAKKFGVSSEDIPDKINFEKSDINPDQIKEFSDKYKKLIYEKLPDEKEFKKEKDGEKSTILVSITNKELSLLFKSLLDELRNEELIIENAKKSNIDLEEYYDSIDNLIEDLDNLEDENGKAEIKMYIENKKATGLDIFLYDENDVVAKIVSKMNDNNLNIKMDVKDEGSLDLYYGIDYDEKNIDINFDMKLTAEETNVELKGKFEYKNIFALDDVEENYSIELRGDMDEINKLEINYTNLVTFDNDIEIEKISEEKSYIINNMSNEELQSFITAIYTKLSNVK